MSRQRPAIARAQPGRPLVRRRRRRRRDFAHRWLDLDRDAKGGRSGAAVSRHRRSGELTTSGRRLTSGRQERVRERSRPGAGRSRRGPGRTRRRPRGGGSAMAQEVDRRQARLPVWRSSLFLAPPSRLRNAGGGRPRECRRPIPAPAPHPRALGAAEARPRTASFHRRRLQARRRRCIAPMLPCSPRLASARAAQPVKKIEAIIKPFKLDEVKDALQEPACKG